MNAPTNQRAQSRDEALAQLGSASKAAMGAIRRLRGRDTHRPGELSLAQYHLLSGLTKCDDTKDLATAAAVLDRLQALYDNLSTDTKVEA
jgi:hypothetical protein